MCNTRREEKIGTMSEIKVKNYFKQQMSIYKYN